MTSSDSLPTLSAPAGHPLHERASDGASKRGPAKKRRSSIILLPRKRIIIVGAGFAGLGAARTIQGAGRDDVEVILLEAADCVGGRARSATLPSGATVEAGATWFHGVCGNPLYEIAVWEGLVQDLRTDPGGMKKHEINWKVDFARPHNPQLLSKRMKGIAEEALERFQSAALELSGDTPSSEPSIGDFMRKRFDEIVASKHFTPKELAVFAESWMFREKQQCSFDGFFSTDDVSASFPWEFETLEGPNMPVPGGFQSIAESLARSLDIRLNHRVTSIEWGSGGVSVSCDNGVELEADAVLITTSIGVLQAHHRTLFQPPLPPWKQAALGAVRLGVADKIFVEFEVDPLDSTMAAVRHPCDGQDEVGPLDGTMAAVRHSSDVQDDAGVGVSDSMVTANEHFVSGPCCSGSSAALHSLALANCSTSRSYVGISGFDDDASPLAPSGNGDGDARGKSRVSEERPQQQQYQQYQHQLGAGGVSVSRGVSGSGGVSASGAVSEDQAQQQQQQQQYRHQHQLGAGGGGVSGSGGSLASFPVMECAAPSASDGGGACTCSGVNATATCITSAHSNRSETDLWREEPWIMGRRGMEAEVELVSRAAQAATGAILSRISSSGSFCSLDDDLDENHLLCDAGDQGEDSAQAGSASRPRSVRTYVMMWPVPEPSALGMRGQPPQGPLGAPVPLRRQLPADSPLSALPRWLQGLHSIRFSPGPDWIQPSHEQQFLDRYRRQQTVPEGMVVEDLGLSARTSESSGPGVVSGVLWITGEAALEMEAQSDEAVQQGVAALLQAFPAVPLPPGARLAPKVVRTRWGTDPNFLGSYSYTCAGLDSGEVVDTLAEPVLSEDGLPVLMFAGEATHRHYMGTAHGAYMSGFREANRFLAYVEQQEMMLQWSLAKVAAMAAHTGGPRGQRYGQSQQVMHHAPPHFGRDSAGYSPAASDLSGRLYQHH